MPLLVSYEIIFQLPKDSLQIALHVFSVPKFPHIIAKRFKGFLCPSRKVLKKQELVAWQSRSTSKYKGSHGRWLKDEKNRERSWDRGQGGTDAERGELRRKSKLLSSFQSQGHSFFCGRWGAHMCMCVCKYTLYMLCGKWTVTFQKEISFWSATKFGKVKCSAGQGRHFPNKTFLEASKQEGERMAQNSALLCKHWRVKRQYLTWSVWKF